MSGKQSWIHTSGFAVRSAVGFDLFLAKWNAQASCSDHEIEGAFYEMAMDLDGQVKDLNGLIEIGFIADLSEQLAEGWVAVVELLNIGDPEWQDPHVLAVGSNGHYTFLLNPHMNPVGSVIDALGQYRPAQSDAPMHPSRKRLRDQDQYRCCTRPEAFVAPAREFGDAVREADRCGYTLPPELAGLDCLEGLLQVTVGTGDVRPIEIAREVWLLGGAIRTAIDYGLENYADVRDLPAIEMLPELARQIRTHIAAPFSA